MGINANNTWYRMTKRRSHYLWQMPHLAEMSTGSMPMIMNGIALNPGRSNGYRMSTTQVVPVHTAPRIGRHRHNPWASTS